MGTISEIPNFLRLLYGLVTDKRVNAVDKLVVAGAIAYILLPVDVIPDFVPFLGEVDDDPSELSAGNLEKIVVACAFFLPRRMRRRLRTIGRV